MGPLPTVEDVIEVAKTLGITLGPEEAALYREQIGPKLNVLEEFMRARVAQDRPPRAAPLRGSGHPPTAADDPFNAWLWKCEIKATDDGLLAGKSVSYKDHVAVAGIPLTFGSYLMKGHVPDIDATIVTRALLAGATVIGKNTMNGPTSGWGFGLPSDHARPMNPHNPEHLTGGSSSGSAVAVAAGEVDIAFGGDQGGSIRIPAAYCGTYGLKPTFGLISHFGVGYGADQSVDYTGPMARYVEDVAAALDAVAGYDPLDPRQDRSVPQSTDAISSLRDGVDGIRIGVLEEGFVGADQDVREAVMAAVDVLVQAGGVATNVSIPEHSSVNSAIEALETEGTRATFDVGFFGAYANTYYPESLVAATYQLFRGHTDRLTPRRKLALIISEFTRRRFHGALYAKAQNVRGTFRRAFDAALERVDVLIMPTSPNVARKHVAATSYLDVAFERRAGSEEVAQSPQCTKPYNYTGHPALTVPCGKSGGLPIGMQLVGRHYDDALLLRVAYAFQHSVDWESIIATTAVGRR